MLGLSMGIDGVAASIKGVYLGGDVEDAIKFRRANAHQRGAAPQRVNWILRIRHAVPFRIDHVGRALPFMTCRTRLMHREHQR